MNRQQSINELLADPEKLLMRKPFTRGCNIMPNNIPTFLQDVNPGGTVRASLPKFKKTVITQEQYMMELDPNCHTVLFDDNIPSICVKDNRNGVQTQEFMRSAIPFQRIIKDKKLLHLAGLPMKFTLVGKNPTEQQQEDFVTFKQYWDLRNQDGMKTKMVDCALSYGDAGLLFYFDYKGRIKSRLISYEDGYVICSHNDENGDRLMESIYYINDTTQCIDSYDDTYMYRHTFNADTCEWHIERYVHGFNEIPLVTKRAKVAWDDAQNLIESYETLYNVFNVIQKKWGWGMLYVKGKISDKARKIAGNIVLNDTSIDGSGDAKFLNPPSPENMIQTLDNIHYRIQEASGCTFILPKDIHSSSDTSGVAVKLTLSLDIQTANNGVIEWQNVADKMVRLFAHGLARELVNTGVDKTAITDFQDLHINASFDVWEPYSEPEYNQMLATLKNAGILSQQTGTEFNTVSRPDELQRIRKEEEDLTQKEMQKLEQTQALNAKYTQKSTNSDQDE